MDKGLYANIHAKRKRIAEGSGEKMRASFKARHAKNIAKGKMSAARPSAREKW